MPDEGAAAKVAERTGSRLRSEPEPELKLKPKLKPKLKFKPRCCIAIPPGQCSKQ